MGMKQNIHFWTKTQVVKVWNKHSMKARCASLGNECDRHSAIIAMDDSDLPWQADMQHCGLTSICWRCAGLNRKEWVCVFKCILHLVPPHHNFIALNLKITNDWSLFVSQALRTSWQFPFLMTVCNEERCIRILSWTGTGDIAIHG